MHYNNSMSALDTWFETLSDFPDMENVHNLFSRHAPEGQIRLANLRRYFNHMLTHQPTILLVGEAPGYQGTYRTGVPFCSESILLGPPNRFGLFGGGSNGHQRVYQDDRLWKEPSATVVQRTLNELPYPVLIWATFPLHPHQPGIDLSNRAPNPKEILLGSAILQELIRLLEPQRIVAVGNVAEKGLGSLGIPALKVRHPSHGGAKLFHDQLLALELHS
jgi:uracil-DNA glycosylase